MLKLKRHKQYLKDFRNQILSEQHYTKYVVYLSALLQKQSLSPEALDHPLKGEWNSYREFHISGDLLVIYTIRDETLELLRIGTHSELFG